MAHRRIIRACAFHLRAIAKVPDEGIVRKVFYHRPIVQHNRLESCLEAVDARCRACDVEEGGHPIAAEHIFVCAHIDARLAAAARSVHDTRFLVEVESVQRRIRIQAHVNSCRTERQAVVAIVGIHERGCRRDVPRARQSCGRTAILNFRAIMTIALNVARHAANRIAPDYRVADCAQIDIDTRARRAARLDGIADNRAVLDKAVDGIKIDARAAMIGGLIAYNQRVPKDGAALYADTLAFPITVLTTRGRAVSRAVLDNATIHNCRPIQKNRAAIAIELRISKYRINNKPFIGIELTAI